MFTQINKPGILCDTHNARVEEIASIELEDKK